MLSQISFSTIVMDSNYLVSLMATDENNVSRTIRMPVALNSIDGITIAALIAKAWNYIPDANPDPLSQTKARKLESINTQWAALEKTGWDSGQGFFLGITPSDVALLVGVYVLAKEASALGLPIPAIIAKDNSSIQFATLPEMTTLLLRYGAARAEMSSTFALKRKAVEAATTLEEVEGIV